MSSEDGEGVLPTKNTRYTNAVIIDNKADSDDAYNTAYDNNIMQASGGEGTLIFGKVTFKMGEKGSKNSLDFTTNKVVEERGKGSHKQRICNTVAHNWYEDVTTSDLIGVTGVNIIFETIYATYNRVGGGKTPPLHG